METRAGPSDEHVSGGDGARIQHVFFFAGTDGEATELDHALWHHAGHLSRFTAGEDAIARLQVFGHTGDNAGDLRLLNLRNAHVIQEHDGVCPSREHVVHIHGHEVFAGGFELVVFQQQLDLCADTVTAGEDHGMLVAAEVVGGGE